VGSPGSRAWSLRTYPGSPTVRAPRRLAFSAAYGVAFRQGVRRRRPEVVISRFHSPACTPPANASSPPRGSLTHGSGPPRFATPSVSDSSIPGSMPVYPGAFAPTPALPFPPLPSRFGSSFGMEMGLAHLDAEESEG
jgi:hypothetical protein